MYTILIIIAIVAVIYYFTIGKKKNENPEVETEVSIEPMARETPTVEAEKVETVEVVAETVEQMEARLQSMTNQDASKPFAKLSVPEFDEAGGIVGSPVEAEVTEAPKPKKKRAYKKRAPKEKKVEKND
jgi:Tfp pilus assembly protein PilO